MKQQLKIILEKIEPLQNKCIDKWDERAKRNNYQYGYGRRLRDISEFKEHLEKYISGEKTLKGTYLLLERCSNHKYDDCQEDFEPYREIMDDLLESAYNLFETEIDSQDRSLVSQRTPIGTTATSGASSRLSSNTAASAASSNVSAATAASAASSNVSAATAASAASSNVSAAAAASAASSNVSAAAAASAASSNVSAAAAASTASASRRTNSATLLAPKGTNKASAGSKEKSRRLVM